MMITRSESLGTFATASCAKLIARLLDSVPRGGFSFVLAFAPAFDAFEQDRGFFASPSDHWP
jgi:hypothetical protein